MNKKNLGIIVTGIVLLIGLSRLLPHPFNFTPVGAMALFAGRYLSTKYLKFAVPFIALYLSDFILNNFVHRIYFPDQEGLIFFSEYMIWTYAAIGAIVLIGWLLLNKMNIKNVLLVSVGYSIAFFVITNFGTWMTGTMYPKTSVGLLECFMLGVPFFKWTLIGNLVYTPILFFTFEYFLAKNSLITQKIN